MPSLSGGPAAAILERAVPRVLSEEGAILDLTQSFAPPPIQAPAGAGVHVAQTAVGGTLTPSGQLATTAQPPPTTAAAAAEAPSLIGAEQGAQLNGEAAAVVEAVAAAVRTAAAPSASGDAAAAAAGGGQEDALQEAKLRVMALAKELGGPASAAVLGNPTATLGNASADSPGPAHVPLTGAAAEAGDVVPATQQAVAPEHGVQNEAVLQQQLSSGAGNGVAALASTVDASEGAAGGH